MNSKRWVILFLCVSLSVLTLFAGIMYWMDPLMHYRAESNYLTYFEQDGLYLNPGIAKNDTYNAVMVGTSMVERTDTAECCRVFNQDMVLLPYSGGTSYNMKTILDLCFSSGNDIQTVYWELDEFQLRSAHDQPRYPLPEYLYRTDHHQDLSYLLNLDIFYSYLLPSWKATRAGYVHGPMDVLHTDAEYSRETALRAYARPEISTQTLPADAYLEAARLNLEHSVLPLVAAHPDTEFVFYFVPFSMLYWDNEVRNGTLDATLESLEYAIETLLAYENVSLYFYHDEWDIASNLNNYRDYSHYDVWVNSYMTHAIAEKQDRLTAENYRQILSDMRQYILEFNYEILF